MIETQHKSNGPFRIDLVSPRRTLDITEFVSGIQYGYSTQPPWDTVGVRLAMPMGFIDKVLPGSRVQTGESSTYNVTPEPGFWVIIYKEDWMDVKGSTAMAVGHVDTIIFGESDVAGISDVPVKGTTPIQLICTGMLSFVGKSNVRITVTSEQNAKGFLYDIKSFKGAMEAQLGNLLSNEVGVMLEALWKDTVKVLSPHGTPAGGAEPHSLDTTQAELGVLGHEMPVVYNRATAEKFAPSRANCIRPVYGSKVLVTPALLPSASLWQWMYSMFVPSSDVVELFATLEPSAQISSDSLPTQYTALGRSLGNVQPVLLYRFKPFALQPINLASIQMQTHTGDDTNTNTRPMAEQLGLFQEDQMTGHYGWMNRYYTLEPEDIFSHQVSYDDSKRVNLVFACPAPVGGYVIRPFSQVGNVVIPNQGEFAQHGMRAFEVDWPYLAIQDLRQTVNFNRGTAEVKTQEDHDKGQQEYAVRRLSDYTDFEEDWQKTFGPFSATSYSPLPQETKIVTGKMTAAQFRAEWNTYLGTINSAMVNMQQMVTGLEQLAAINPRYTGPQTWASLPGVETTLAAIDVKRAFYLNQYNGLNAQPVATKALPSIAPVMYMAKVYYEELDKEYKLLEALRNVVNKLKLSSTNTMPLTAQATAGGGGVSAPGAFKAEKTVQDQFSALNELLWSIMGEGERFANMTLQLRGRPLMRQGHWISGDLGPRPQKDTIYRYFTGYIEQVDHSFGVAGNGEWQSRTTLQLSRVWFSREQYEHYTPVAASSLGNQTKSDSPERVLKSKSSGGTNHPNKTQYAMWDLSKWENFQKAYELPAAKKADRTNPASDYAVKCFILHHTNATNSSPKQTLRTWKTRSNKSQEKGSAKELASHFEVAPDGVVYMYYDPDTDVVNHTRCRRSVDKYGYSGDPKLFAGNISIGIDFTGDLIHNSLTSQQVDSGTQLLSYLSIKYGIPLKPFPLPVSHDRGDASEMSELVTPKVVFGNSALFAWDKSDVYKNTKTENQTFTVFGHGSWDRTQCPGKNMDLQALCGTPHAEAGSPFAIRTVTNASAPNDQLYLHDVFPEVTF